MEETFDVIVVGAGIIGTCTAYHCQKIGLKTLLLEKFQLGHWNGSSHGKSRITRYAHTDAPYIPIVDDAFKQIDDLERKRGEKLWKKTGLMWFGSPKEIENISDHLVKANLAHDVLDSNQMKAKFSQFDYDHSWKALFDPMGGVIFVEKWHEAFQDEFKKLGGLILENQAVSDFSESNGVTSVRTTTRVFHSKKLIFTVGTWLQSMIPEITQMAQVRPERMAVTYWRPKDIKDVPKFTMDQFPVFIVHNAETGDDGYGLPCRDYPDAIKFCDHYGEPFNVWDGEKPPSPKNVSNPGEHLEKHIPLLDGTKPAYLDRCKYTMSIDKHYVIDFHPTNRNVLIGGCMSGSGFKVAPGIGRVLAHMAAGKELPYDMSFFSLKRFEKSHL
ncbi:unnamed protein product, partial [Mesorhabditis belari]|uniref:sarcosine oxidasee (formaldehyde-forming) n=1 Tax=Mesorhabditis belari TaxID=2138241 RepID=A0AAF3ETA8_9BILA